jgi:hypothetical protein
VKRPAPTVAGLSMVVTLRDAETTEHPDGVEAPTQPHDDEHEQHAVMGTQLKVPAVSPGVQSRHPTQPTCTWPIGIGAADRTLARRSNIAAASVPVPAGWFTIMDSSI